MLQLLGWLSVIRITLKLMLTIYPFFPMSGFWTWFSRTCCQWLFCQSCCVSTCPLQLLVKSAFCPSSVLLCNTTCFLRQPVLFFDRSIQETSSVCSCKFLSKHRCLLFILLYVLWYNLLHASHLSKIYSSICSSCLASFRQCIFCSLCTC